MGDLKSTTLLLVRRAAERRELLSVSRATGVPYHVLTYIITKPTPKVDADVCQTLYEHLSGNALVLTHNV